MVGGCWSDRGDCAESNSAVLPEIRPYSVASLRRTPLRRARRAASMTRRPKGDHRHRILEVFTKIYEKNDLPENDYKIFAEKLMRVPALNRRFAGTGPEGNYRLRILEVFTTIYKKNNLSGNQYDIFVRELMGVARDRSKRGESPMKSLDARAPIIPGGVDSDVIDLTDA